MRVCLFGSDPEGYNRNVSWAQAMNSVGIEVCTCLDWTSNPLVKPFKLISRYIKNHKNSDVILVGGFSHTNVPLAYLLGKLYHVPVVFAPLYSRYDTEVLDRQNIKDTSLKAKLEWMADWISSKMTNYLLVDTEKCIEFYHDTFHVPKVKIRKSWIGTDEDLFYPRPSEPSAIKKVLYFGNYIALHGIPHIIRAAELLKEREDIEFIFLGDGQERPRTESKIAELGLTNIKMIPRVTPEELAQVIADCDIGLGVFGDSDKANRHIPNKIFQVIAMEKPLVTSRTDAILEAFTEGEDCLLCDRSSGESLAEAIQRLVDNPGLMDKVKKNGRKLFVSTFSRKQIGLHFKKLLESITKNV